MLLKIFAMIGEIVNKEIRIVMTMNKLAKDFGSNSVKFPTNLILTEWEEEREREK